MKSRPDFHETSRHRQHEQRKKQVRIHRLYEKETNVAMIWTQRSSNGICGPHTIGNGTSR